MVNKQEHRRALAQSAELRHVRAELRASESKTALTVSGMAMKYGVAYQVRDAWGTFIETMHQGVLGPGSTADVRFLVGHTGLPLARSVSGTLTLTDTPAGLSIRADMSPKSQTAQDLYSAVERGDVSQMSVGFVVAPDGDEWGLDATGTETRDVRSISELFDVSAVAFAASPTTSIAALRSARAFEQRAGGRLFHVGFALDAVPGKPSKLYRRQARALLAAARQPTNPEGQQRAAQFEELAESYRQLDTGRKGGRRK